MLRGSKNSICDQNVFVLSALLNNGTIKNNTTAPLTVVLHSTHYTHTEPHTYTNSSTHLFVVRVARFFLFVVASGFAPHFVCVFVCCRCSSEKLKQNLRSSSSLCTVQFRPWPTDDPRLNASPPPPRGQTKQRVCVWPISPEIVSVFEPYISSQPPRNHTARKWSAAIRLRRLSPRALPTDCPPRPTTPPMMPIRTRPAALRPFRRIGASSQHRCRSRCAIESRSFCRGGAPAPPSRHHRWPPCCRTTRTIWPIRRTLPTANRRRRCHRCLRMRSGWPTPTAATRGAGGDSSGWCAIGISAATAAAAPRKSWRRFKWSRWPKWCVANRRSRSSQMRSGGVATGRIGPALAASATGIGAAGIGQSGRRRLRCCCSRPRSCRGFRATHCWHAFLFLSCSQMSMSEINFQRNWRSSSSRWQYKARLCCGNIFLWMASRVLGGCSHAEHINTLQQSSASGWDYIWTVSNSC